MLTPPYSLKDDYSAATKVSASDLNRRARILSSQLPGALRCASLSEGIFPLWNPDEALTNAELVADLLADAQDCLKVSLVGNTYSAAAGAATVLHPSGALIYTQTQGLSASQGFNDPDYIHLLLTQPVDPLAPGVVDAMTGSPPTLLVSDLESEVGAILLASVSGGVVTDRRRFSLPVLLAVEFAQLQQQLDALAAPVDPEGDGPTAAQFASLQDSVTQQGHRIAALEAFQATLVGADDDFPTTEDQLADEIAINRAGLAEVNPHAIERGQISVVVVGAGLGQNDTPNYAPATGAPNELPWDEESGTFGT